MNLAIFGLTISSSWGNGHSTLWRGLCRALGDAGHRVVFYERDVPYYAGARDLYEVPGGGELVLYGDWNDICGRAKRDIADADVALVTSYCPDAIAAAELVGDSGTMSVFYDLDTPVTLSRIMRGEQTFYIGPRGLSDFNLVLSYTGGGALDALRERLGARVVAPLYGHVDPERHRPAEPCEIFRGDFSYLGTYAVDRQPLLERLFLDPARRRPQMQFVIGGAQYPFDFPWARNIYFVRHLAPGQHAAFYCSSRATLNITRADMAAMGWCPSGRLFEASACGVPIVSDWWEGLDTFFAPGSEIAIADSADHVLAALDMGDGELARIATRARDRALAEHTSVHRARELVAILEEARGGARPAKPQHATAGV